MQTRIDKFDGLPLWGKVLVASRVVARGAMALPEGEARTIALEACDQLARSASEGLLLAQAFAAEERIETLTTRGRQLGRSEAAALRHVREALAWAADAAHAANDAGDFAAADGACANSAANAIASAAACEALSAAQVWIVAGSDADLIDHFAREKRVGRYDGLGEAGKNLPPMHAFELIEVKMRPEDSAR